MYQLSSDQQQFATRAREVAQERIASVAAEVDEQGRFPSEAIAALGEAGLMGLLVPT